MPKRYRVMVVDDDEATLDFLEVALEGSYEVVRAHDGFDALEKLTKTQPDLLVLDVAMPLMNGLETCQAIRSKPAFEKTEVIFLSAKDDSATIKKAYEVGGNLFVKKPIDAERLALNVKMSLEKAGAPREKRHSLIELRSMFAPGKSKPEPPVARETAPRRAPLPQPPPLTAPPTSPAAPKRVTPRPPDPPKTRPRVMIVDDDPEIVSLLELSFQDSYEMCSAHDGLQAIERIVEYEPDILLVDIMMPKMNGFQLCTSLRRNATYRDTPILMITAKSNRKDREYASRCGANAFVTKPFNVSTLGELIDAITQKETFRVRVKKHSYSDIRKLQRAEEQDMEDRRRRLAEHGESDPYKRMKDIIDGNR